MRKQNGLFTVACNGLLLHKQCRYRLECNPEVYVVAIRDNKAIDDFAEKLCNEVESFTATVDGIELDFVSLDYLIEFAYEVSKQLKSKTEL